MCAYLIHRYHWPAFRAIQYVKAFRPEIDFNTQNDMIDLRDPQIQQLYYFSMRRQNKYGKLKDIFGPVQNLRLNSDEILMRNSYLNVTSKSQYYSDNSNYIKNESGIQILQKYNQLKVNKQHISWIDGIQYSDQKCSLSLQRPQSTSYRNKQREMCGQFDVNSKLDPYISPDIVYSQNFIYNNQIGTPVSIMSIVQQNPQYPTQSEYIRDKIQKHSTNNVQIQKIQKEQINKQQIQPRELQKSSYFQGNKKEEQIQRKQKTTTQQSKKQQTQIQYTQQQNSILSSSSSKSLNTSLNTLLLNQSKLTNSMGNYSQLSNQSKQSSYQQLLLNSQYSKQQTQQPNLQLSYLNQSQKSVRNKQQIQQLPTQSLNQSRSQRQTTQIQYESKSQIPPHKQLGRGFNNNYRSYSQQQINRNSFSQQDYNNGYIFSGSRYSKQ